MFYIRRSSIPCCIFNYPASNPPLFLQTSDVLWWSLDPREWNRKEIIYSWLCLILSSGVISWWAVANESPQSKGWEVERFIQVNWPAFNMESGEWDVMESRSKGLVYIYLLAAILTLLLQRATLPRPAWWLSNHNCQSKTRASWGGLWFSSRLRGGDFTVG